MNFSLGFGRWIWLIRPNSSWLGFYPALDVSRMLGLGCRKYTVEATAALYFAHAAGLTWSTVRFGEGFLMRVAA